MNSKFFIFWILIISLVSMVVANSLDFHIEKKISAQTNHGAQGPQDHDHEHDPCDSGHCHLGHCAVLLLPVFESISLSLNASEYLAIPFFAFLNRTLDGPFQPPKA